MNAYEKITALARHSCLMLTALIAPAWAVDEAPAITATYAGESDLVYVLKVEYWEANPEGVPRLIRDNRCEFAKDSVIKDGAPTVGQLIQLDGLELPLQEGRKTIRSFKDAAQQTASSVPDTVNPVGGLPADGRRSKNEFMKGVDFFSWRADDNKLHFRIMPGTNRKKTVVEITSPAGMIADMKALRGEIRTVPIGKELSWGHLGMNAPTAEEFEAVKGMAHLSHVDISDVFVDPVWVDGEFPHGAMQLRSDKPSMKGKELYCWRAGDGDLRFSLLTGTNESKTMREIQDPSATMTSTKALKTVFEQSAIGEQVCVNPVAGTVLTDSEHIAIVELARSAQLKLVGE